MRAYRIRNKDGGQFLSGKRGQVFFKSKKFAKSSFNYQSRFKFDNQDQWEIVEYILVEKDIYEKMSQALDILENGDGPGEEDGPWAEG